MRAMASHPTMLQGLHQGHGFKVFKSWMICHMILMQPRSFLLVGSCSIISGCYKYQGFQVLQQSPFNVCTSKIEAPLPIGYWVGSPFFFWITFKDCINGIFLSHISKYGILQDYGQITSIIPCAWHSKQLVHSCKKCCNLLGVYYYD